MIAPLSANELQALDWKVSSLSRDVAEVASLLRSRYGENDELAALAKSLSEDHALITRLLRRRAMVARGESLVAAG
jgi:hypothetical protein